MTMDHDNDTDPGRIASAENVAMVEAARSHVDGNESFAAIYEHYRLLVRSCLLSYGIRSNDVEDLSQQVFIQAMQKLDQLEDPAALPGWLKTITHNIARSFHTRTRKLLCFSELAPDENTLPWIQSHDAAPPDIIDERDNDPSIIVSRLIGQLPSAMERQMAEEFYVQGLSLEQMTGIPDCDTGRFPPIGTVKRRLHTVRKHLSMETVPSCD